jgi:hypothetical protein
MPVVAVQKKGIAVVAAGRQGPAGANGVPGANGQGAAIPYVFSWGDATPALIANVPAGKVVFKVEVVLLAAFNVASTVTVGDAGNTSRLFSTADIDLSSAATYQSNPNHLYGSLTAVNLYVSPGVGNSQGNGIVLLYVED